MKQGNFKLLIPATAAMLLTALVPYFFKWRIGRLPAIHVLR